MATDIRPVSLSPFLKDEYVDAAADLLYHGAILSGVHRLLEFQDGKKHPKGVVLLNLSDFSRYIDPAVVHRGKEYASEGRVISLKSIADEKYTAVVRGYEDYEVYVRLDNENNIMESECDCPYDFGPVCKHQVAVFLELKNREADGVSSPEPSLRQLLEAESKEKLIELLLSIASDSYTAEERIRLHLSKRGADQELDACRRLIRSYIDTYSDDQGFVSWRNVSRAVEGAKIVAEKALSAFDEEEWLHGLAILFCIIEEMIEPEFRKCIRSMQDAKAMAT